MSSRRVEEARPHERAALAAVLGARLRDWPPGRTFLARSAEGLLAMARLGEPSPGDGYHREHVRVLRWQGEGEALGEVLGMAVAAAGDPMRVEAEIMGRDAGTERALAAAGLVREGELPEAWRAGARLEPLQAWGRPALRRRGAPAPEAPRVRAGDARGDVRVVVHSPETKTALAAFLDSLAPGRAYPAGTLLSDAETAETRRPGDLDARWVLALDPVGAVVGGVLLEPDARPERAHVLRVHVDVAPGWRRRGIAARLFREARRVAGRWGAVRLESDPRSGNAGACGALAKAGFERCGEQAGAWRMRTPRAAWDESLVLFSAPVA